MQKTDKSILNEIISVREAADIAGVAWQTVYCWIHRKKITPRRVGGSVFFVRSEFLESLQSLQAPQHG